MDYLITHSSVSKQGVFQICYKIPRGIFRYGEKKAIACKKGKKARNYVVTPKG